MDAPQPFWLIRLFDAVRKTRVCGKVWLRNRLHEEFRTPTTGPGKILRRILIGFESGLDLVVRVGLRAVAKRGNDDVLYFFYDLEVCPITYDIASYMALAELDRRRLGLKSIHVIIVPGRRLEREAEDYDGVVGPEERQARIFDIVVPVIRLLPLCQGYTICASRELAAALHQALTKHTFPADYQPRFPTHPDGRDVRRRAKLGEVVFPIFRATQGACHKISAFLDPRTQGRRIVVITLREYGYMTARNSNYKNWIAFADGLDPYRYAVVFVRDTSRAMEPVPKDLSRHIVCESASLNVDLRMALYEQAYLNMAIMHGPMELCWYNDNCRYLVFLGVGTAPQTARDTLIRNDFAIGSSLPFARTHQKIVWEQDNLPAICREFDAMESTLDSVPISTSDQSRAGVAARDGR